MWVYEQCSGRLLHNTELAGVGYAGYGEGKNNSWLETAISIGPIPHGAWAIGGPPRNTKAHGPYVLRLTPDKSTNTYGRAGFLIHGDSVKAPGTASRGCIIVARAVRVAVWQSGDRDLRVVTGSTGEQDERSA